MVITFIAMMNAFFIFLLYCDSIEDGSDGNYKTAMCMLGICLFFAIIGPFITGGF